MNMCKKYLLSFFVIILTNISYNDYLSAQVTIGLGEPPEKGTLLQLKEKDNITDDTSNAYRGLGLPRVILSKKDQLYPMFLLDPENPSSGANSEYLANKSDLDKSHTGLIVYNLNEDDFEGLCKGLNQWDGREWNCLQEKIGNSVAYIDDCERIAFVGQYFNNIYLGSGNYMSITLNVTKPGAYTITARAGYAGNPSQDNGYYFTTTGQFLTVGKYSLQVPASGTPLHSTPTGNSGDIITITMNEKPLLLSDGSSSCDKNIIIEDSSKKPEYTMICNETVVKGVYQLDQELDNTNYIEMILDVDLEAVGATYLIETNTVDGIYFKGQGLLTTAGNQTIKLQGYGTPNTFEEKVFTIKSNSSKTTATCKTSVFVALNSKVTYAWGLYNNTAGYLMQIISNKKQGTRAIVDADINFGTNENSAVKIVKHSVDQTFDHSILSDPDHRNPAKVKDMFLKKPDFVLTGFDLDIANATNRSTISSYMVDYLNLGGVLILILERDYMAKSFFEALYPGITVSVSSLQGSTRYQLSFMNDDILNGPFGDIRGKFWGNDAGGAISITGLPEEDIIVYSRDSNGRPFIFKHKYLNLFFVGEGGVFANFNGTSGSNAGSTALGTIYPLAFDTDFRPMTRTWSGGDVENGRLFANIIAWAIKTAQFNGINK